MISKTLMQMVLLFIGLLMIGGFLLETLGRWSSSRGPLATARLVNKVETIRRKAASNAFSLELKFRRQNGDSVVATTDVSQSVYSGYSIGNRIPIHYQLHNPRNAVAATEGWFEWETLGILAFGLMLIYACFDIREGGKAVPEQTAS